jgi:hypothetical protein
VIFYGKSGEFATNRRDQQELGMLSLHILQAALVYVNTLMIQDILAEPEWGQAPRAVREFLGSHKHHYRALKALQRTRRRRAYAMHALRIAHQGQELLSTGSDTVDRVLIEAYRRAWEGRARRRHPRFQ